MIQKELFSPTFLPLPSCAPEMKLYTARNLVDDNAKTGIDCPCCGQFAKIYKRKINTPMSRFLIWFVMRYESDPRWYSLYEFPLFQGCRGGGDFPKLRYWNLLVQKENEDPEKKCSGIWKTTPKAREFVYQETKLPSHVYLYNGKMVGYTDELTDITECLGKKFSYPEVMQTVSKIEIPVG